MDNFRALCSALVDAIDSESPFWEEELTSIADHARAALAEPVPPAEGEVAELVDRLRRASDGASAMGWEQDSWTIARAAELLEQRHPAPVPVAERLPGPEDCDADGKCWWFNPGQPAMSNPHIATSSWRLCRMLNGKPMGTHWTPANSLPLPNKGAE